MIFDITHQMDFDFSCPVFFEPMTVRLCPRSDAAQTLQLHRLDVTPTPAQSTRITGLDGNIEETLCFSGLHQKLTLTASSRIQTHRTNPFDFLLSGPRYSTLPFSYGPVLSPILAPYLEQRPESQGSKVFREFTEMVRSSTKLETIPFLTCLARVVQESFSYTVRQEGDPYPPERTLEIRGGTCRDFALLAMEACRFFGLASRYTGGYHVPPGTQGEPSLHAWIEVYLPGAGWRGLDPSEGLMTADHHIALASSAFPSLTLPTEGHFRGEGPSTLSTRITIENFRGQDRIKPDASPGSLFPT
jgi:transglutaminase-like putative cysteine protease